MGDTLDATTDLINRTCEAYFNLRALQPGHELLIYFTLNGDNFGFNPDMKVREEFLNKFGTAGRLNGFKSFSDYRAAVVKKQFGNYKSALEEAIRKFLEE